MEKIVADIAGQPADFKINWGSEKEPNTSSGMDMAVFINTWHN